MYIRSIQRGNKALKIKTKIVKKATIRAVHKGWLIEGLNFDVSSLSAKGVVLEVLDLIEFANTAEIQILNKSHLLKIHSDQLKY